MNRRHFVGIAGMTLLTGCTELGGEKDPSRLDLTVQNDRPTAVTVDVTVVDDQGTTVEAASDRIDSGEARSFDVTVGTDGRHEVTVAGDEWQGQLAWNAGTCALFDGTVRVTGERVEVAGECTEHR